MIIHNKEDIKLIISTLNHKLKSSYHIKNLSLFGSYARGDQNVDSDIDILVDFDTTPGGVLEMIKKSMHGTIKTVVVKPIRQERNYQIPGDFMICLVLYGNSVKIGIIILKSFGVACGTTMMV